MSRKISFKSHFFQEPSLQLHFSRKVLLKNISSEQLKPSVLRMAVNGGLNKMPSGGQQLICKSVKSTLKLHYSRWLQWKKSCTCVCVHYFAATLSRCLVAVGVEAFVGVTVTRPAGRRAPPAPRTLVVNSAQTQTPTEQLKKHTHKLKTRQGKKRQLLCKR